MSQDTKSIVKLYFKESDLDSSKWKCLCGKELTQKKNTGWTNLFNHVKSQHPEFQQLVKTQPSIEKFVTVTGTTKKGKTIYGWLNWVCCGLKPFNFVENEQTRMYSTLSPISENTLKKYLEVITRVVEEKISQILPAKFVIIIDGWTKKSTHFVGIFASYNSNNSNGYETLLLAFSPLLEETGFTAKNHYDLLKYILNIYKKSIDNVMAICGDNAGVNKALANLCQVPLVGCASHRFNLAIMDYLVPYGELIDKVNILMGKFKNLKIAGILRRFTPLKPIQKNITRWSSILDMIDRYEQLKCFFSDPMLTQEKCLMDYFPTTRENNEISILHGHLKKLNSITIALQREDITIGDVRYLFDEIIEAYPGLYEYLGTNSNIIHQPTFENALIKIQNKKIHDMTIEEKLVVSDLKIFSLDSDVATDFSTNSEDFVSSALRKRKLDQQMHVSCYMDTRFIVSTSNLVERLFSYAGYTFDDNRQKLSPVNLEMQIFLKANKRLWNEMTVSENV